MKKLSFSKAALLNRCVKAVLEIGPLHGLTDEEITEILSSDITVRGAAIVSGIDKETIIKAVLKTVSKQRLAA